MKSMNVPATSQPVCCLGFAEDITTTGRLNVGINGYVRIKNIGDEIGHVRKFGDGGDGIALSPGETEYFYINNGEQLEIVDGQFNIMY